ncbi:malto-oligosyltrehalose trehalohydrolase [Roseomonas terrae]|uniref:Malto-oligosyltrehalose trehalohydrolase n=1 Tax=Neoroseomonas terrae TaxID=424799 RepID=A0ABS5ECQ7_9PROT|nr:malto-oligosyltrehalose trehalohydrolase [Neoroseomonas terrae]
MTRFGPVLLPGGGVMFRLWAPDACSVAVALPGRSPIAMEATSDGFFSLTVSDAGPGQRYRFRIGEHEVPDPASRRQDGDPAGWSVVQAPLPPMRQASPPRPWHEVILTELHVGTATPEGTFEGIAARLDHFAAAGFTAIELMPVAEFPGCRNWGYDAVLPFAPDEAYGSPAALRDLVDAAHHRGLGMVLDVVYNHFGPEGNYVSLFAARFFNAAHTTPWGDAIDLGEPLVRRYFIENALMWLTEYDFDGLRFDAVHAFAAPGGDVFLRELAEACRSVKPDAWLVLENDDNAARWLERDTMGRPRFFTAQWNDDAHHALHVASTGERRGYYADFSKDPIADVQRALAEGFVYQDNPSTHRGGKRRGEPSRHLPPTAFVNFVQNHDQIGNRPRGDRLAASMDAARLDLLRFLLLLEPAVPLFFQGEEAALDTPFPFFCDFAGELGEAVRRGRREEFRDLFHGTAEVPDPLDPATMESAKLAWDALTPTATAPFRDLVAHRERLVIPLLGTAYLGASTIREGAALVWRWRFASGTLCLAANLDTIAVDLDVTPTAGSVSVGDADFDGSALRLGAWSGCAWAEPA